MEFEIYFDIGGDVSKVEKATSITALKRVIKTKVSAWRRDLLTLGYDQTPASIVAVYYPWSTLKASDSSRFEVGERYNVAMTPVSTGSCAALIRLRRLS